MRHLNNNLFTNMKIEKREGGNILNDISNTNLTNGNARKIIGTSFIEVI